MSNWPNFFIIGAPRAGTTSLYEYLRRHPEVFMCPVKEPGFFSPLIQSQPFRKVWEGTLVTDEKNYLRLFEGAESYKAVGEATPLYLFDERTPYLIREEVPDARFIVLLRDPLEQIVSHYLKIALSVPFESFRGALEDSKWGWYLIHAATYTPAVKRYFQTFGRDRVLILLFDDLKSDPKRTLLKVCEFLEVSTEPVQEIPFRRHNPSRMARNQMLWRLFLSRRHGFLRLVPIPKPLVNVLRALFFAPEGRHLTYVDNETKRKLIQLFEKDISDLEKLLGQTLPMLRRSWRTSS